MKTDHTFNTDEGILMLMDEGEKGTTFTFAPNGRYEDRIDFTLSVKQFDMLRFLLTPKELDDRYLASLEAS